MAVAEPEAPETGSDPLRLRRKLKPNVGGKGSDAVCTVASASREWTAKLARAGIEEAAADVRRLLAEALGISTARALAEPERLLAQAELETLNAYVARRAKHEPVSRILGWREFYGRPFTISPATLDPRPDTETLIEAARQIVGEEGWEARRGLKILDVGTGSGCLLVTLLSEIAGAHGCGTDISPAALEVARGNAERLEVADRASWLVADALESVSGPFHMLVSNPPYVRTQDIAHLEREVCCFDPLSALDGGADGLMLYRRLAGRIPEVVPDGWVLLEVGYDQADAVASILSGAIGSEAVADMRIYRDVAGMRRCVAVRTRAQAYAQKALGLSQ
jgi:release factor glutamine methyltransferase